MVRKVSTSTMRDGSFPFGNGTGKPTRVGGHLPLKFQWITHTKRLRRTTASWKGLVGWGQFRWDGLLTLNLDILRLTTRGLQRFALGASGLAATSSSSPRYSRAWSSMVGLGGALSLRDHLPYETQCVGEAQPTRGKSSLFSRLYHHRPDHVVGYEQTVDLLHDTDSFLGANGRVRGTLVALYLVHGQLELPARMVGHHQLLGCGSFGVNKRGDQAMLDVVAWAVRILKGITDQAHQHPFSPLAPLVLGGSHPHQLRTVREGCYGRSGLDRLRQPSQQLAAARVAWTISKLCNPLSHSNKTPSPTPRSSLSAAARSSKSWGHTPASNTAWVAHSLMATTLACGQALVPRGEWRLPKTRTFSGVSGKSSTVPSTAIRRGPNKNASGTVSGSAKGLEQILLNRATRGLAPNR